MPRPRKDRPQRQPKPLLHIYCEGEKTEPYYFQGYLDCYFPTNRRLHVIKIEKRARHTPKELVEDVVKIKKSANANGLADSFWLVYDRESPHTYSDALHAEAFANAKRNNIAIAFSNVCFEMWLLLHIEYTTKPYRCYDDLRDNSRLRPFLNAKGFDYEKGARDIFDIFKGGLADARERAKRMNEQTLHSAQQSRCQPFQLNPYTDVYTLLDAIDEIANVK